MLIIVLSPVLIIKGLSQTSRMQYLIPYHQENVFLQSVVCGAIVNLIVNIVLIPRLGAMGAVIGTLVAELVTCFWQYAKINKSTSIGRTVLNSSVYLAFGFIMFLSVRFIALFTSGGLIGLMIEVLTGGIVYMGLCMLYWKVTNSSIMMVLMRRTNNI